MRLGLPRLLGVRVVLGCLLCLLLRLLRGGALASVLLLLAASVGGCAKIVGRVRRAGWSGVERGWRVCEGCVDSTMELPRVHGSPPNHARWNPVDFNNDCHRWWPSFNVHTFASGSLMTVLYLCPALGHHTAGREQRDRSRNTASASRCERHKIEMAWERAKHSRGHTAARLRAWQECSRHMLSLSSVFLVPSPQMVQV
jgi:hypothetical protein